MARQAIRQTHPFLSKLYLIGNLKNQLQKCSRHHLAVLCVGPGQANRHLITCAQFFSESRICKDSVSGAGIFRTAWKSAAFRVAWRLGPEKHRRPAAAWETFSSIVII